MNSSPPVPAPPPSGLVFDTQLTRRAISLASQLEDAVTAYHCGVQHYNHHRHDEAWQLAEQSRLKLILLLSQPFGLTDT